MSFWKKKKHWKHKQVTNSQIAKAKINLCLHVTGQRADGYHQLDSLVVFADFGDRVECLPADHFSLSIDGPFGAKLSAGKDNLITRAADLLNGVGAHVRLTKNLPVASGIGGGSADAAAALRGLSDLWGVELPADNGLSLGADIPACLASCATRMQGIGECLTTIDSLPSMAAILVNSGDAISTPKVFAALDRKENLGIGEVPDGALTFDDTIFFLNALRNDLQIPAVAQAPNITRVLSALSNSGAALSRMSGSGATCFGLFDSFAKAEIAAHDLRIENPNWWVQVVTLNARD
jgi:4-diphosphocytidyl-2-C-methyl-D-erythritol kinase